MNYLIIGNSVAAISAVETIRTYDKDGKIVMLSDDSEGAYSRPLIAEYLSKTIDVNKMWYRSNDFYTNNQVELRLNTKVVSVDPQAKVVKTNDNELLSYDKLLIASGGTPFLPHIDGMETDGIFTFVRWEEVKKLEQYAEKNNVTKVVVIGGGLIGLKSAEHLRKLGLDVTLVELADALLKQVLDTQASKILKNHFEEHGVKVLTENTVNKINSQDGKIKSVILNSGEEIDCQLLVIAIGVIPSKSFLNDSGIITNKGIIVNNKMQTNNDAVYAAGDVAEAFEILSGENKLLPIWPLAHRQGKIAGSNMAGHHEEYAGGISMNSLEFFHMPVIAAGYPRPIDDSCEEMMIINERKNIYKKIIIKDNKLIGFIYLNQIDRAGILNSLIQDKEDVSEFKSEILKDKFGIINLPMNLREKKMASVTK